MVGGEFFLRSPRVMLAQAGVIGYALAMTLIILIVPLTRPAGTAGYALIRWVSTYGHSSLRVSCADRLSLCV